MELKTVLVKKSEKKLKIAIFTINICPFSIALNYDWKDTGDNLFARAGALLGQMAISLFIAGAEGAEGARKGFFRAFGRLFTRSVCCASGP